MTDYSGVTDVKTLIEWLKGRINTLETLRDSLNHTLEPDDEYTLLTCNLQTTKKR